MKRTSLTYVKDTLKAHGFSPLKKFGQNFIIDENILNKIIQLTGESRYIVEVGPGLGALTEKLAEAAEKLAAVEIDQGFYAFLTNEFKNEKNVAIINGDILKTDIKGLCSEQFGDGSVTVAANLPYYITSACIMAFLTADIALTRMVVMVQKEVAQRICAKPGSRDYGLLSVIIDYYGNAEIGMIVKSGCFYPKPDVDSAVMVITVGQTDRTEAETFIAFVKACFAMKRKTLVNNLIKAGYERQAVIEALAETGLDADVRAETLGVNAFISLINRLNRS